jgi:hypothetical protein
MIPLGSGEIPTTVGELTDRITAGIRAALRLTAPSRLSVESAFDSNTEIGQIAIDATGAFVTSIPEGVPDTGTPIGQVFVRRVQLVASPIRVLDLPVAVSGELEDLHANWSRTGSGDLWLTPNEPSADRPTTGHGTATIATADIERVAHDLLAAQLRSRGFQLKSFDLAVTQAGPNGVRIEGHATVGKSFLSAKVTVTGTGTLDDQLALHVTDVALASPNAMVSAAISPFAGPIEEWNGRVIRLADFVLAGVRVQSAHLRVAHAVEVHVEFGSDTPA